MQDKYTRVPRWALELYTDLCPVCVSALPRKVNTAGSQPIVTKGFQRRGQIDLIDFQSLPDGDYKFLLNYQDHGIKLDKRCEGQRSDTQGCVKRNEEGVALG